MGRAIVRKPAAFLFDEPLSNLDAKLRVSMRGEIRKLQRRLGTTSIYVTHDQLEAMTLADRLVVLNAGRIEQIGSPLDIYHKPASTFVAGFIGSPAMNLLKTTRAAGGWAIGSQVLPGVDASTGSDVLTVGLRAEDLTIVSADAAGLAMKLDYVEELGAQRLLHGTVDGQPLVVATAAEDDFADQIRVAIEPRDLHYFDAVSGKRIEGTTL
jgi:sn-glycerol 3-phosphate transport system ATP-binding protein